MKKSLLFLLILSASFSAFAKKATRPNVLIIYTDDHRYSALHCDGNEQIKTPHIDQLSESGITFDNAYLMGAFTGATCAPSRAMLQTGQQLFQLKAKGFAIPEEHKTLGQVFQESGYDTHIIGKWHQDRTALSRSFTSGSTIMGIGVYLTDHYRMPLWDWDETGEFSKKDAYLLEYDEQGKIERRAITKDDKRGPTATEKDGPHTSEIFADEAINYISARKKKKPFMMYLAFHAPHDPRQAPQKYKDMYPEDEIILPPSYMSQHPFDNGHQILRDELLAPFPRTKEVVQKHLSDYYAIITHLDEQIGRVIKALKESGEYENTLIVVSGDSGLAVGNHGLIGKQSVYNEDGIHVPLIFSGGIIKDEGRRENALCYILDIFPTVCDFAQVTVPENVDAVSLLPIIKEEKEEVRPSLYHAYMQYQRAYRKGDYKLIEYVRAPSIDNKGNVEVRGSRVTQLFNIKEDMWETQNLSFFPENFELIDSLRKEMKVAAIELGDDASVDGVKVNFWDYF